MKLNKKTVIKAGRLAITGILLLASVVMLGYVWTGYRGATEWKSVRQKLSERGEPLTIGELIPDPVPEDRNLAFAPVFRGLDWEGGGSNPDPFSMKWSLGENAALADWRERLLPEFENPGEVGGLGDADLIIRYLSRYPLDDLGAELTNRPEVVWPVRYEKTYQATLPHVRVLMNAAKLFLWRSKAYHESGQTDKALADLEYALKLAGASAKGSSLIGVLVKNTLMHRSIEWAVEMVESGKLSAADIARMERSLESLNPLASLKEGYRWERASFVEVIVQMNPEESKLLASFSPPDGDSIHPLQWRLFVWLYPDGWRDQDRAFYGRIVQEYLLDAIDAESGVVDVGLIHQGGVLVDEAFAHEKWVHLFSGLALPPVMRNVPKNVAHGATLQHQALMAFALERYALNHGAYPADLKALQPEYLNSLYVDPVTGRDFHYHMMPSGNGYQLYSLGWNQKDDGGQRAVDDEKVPSSRFHSRHADWVMEISR